MPSEHREEIEAANAQGAALFTLEAALQWVREQEKGDPPEELEDGEPEEDSEESQPDEETGSPEGQDGADTGEQDPQIEERDRRGEPAAKIRATIGRLYDDVGMDGNAPVPPPEQLAESLLAYVEAETRGGDSDAEWEPELILEAIESEVQKARRLVEWLDEFVPVLERTAQQRLSTIAELVEEQGQDQEADDRIIDETSQDTQIDGEAIGSEEEREEAEDISSSVSGY